MSTLVIGDLHGCGEEFAELLDVARRERADARVVIVGDLFTKGPRPELVVDLIADRRATGRRVDLVCGNHDLRLLEALRRRDAGAALDTLAPSEATALRLLDRRPIEGLRPGEEAVVADLRDRAALARAVEGCDALVHLAGAPDPRDFEEMFRANVRGLYDLFEAARAAGVRASTVMTWRSRWARTSSTRPSNTSRPRSMMATRSQTCST